MLQLLQTFKKKHLYEDGRPNLSLELKLGSHLTRKCPYKAKHVDSEKLPEHLQDLHSRTGEHLSDSDAECVKVFLLWNQDVFWTTKFDFGRTSLIEHRIDTGMAKPSRMPLATDESGCDDILDLLERGVVKPSRSTSASPLVLVPEGFADYACAVITVG